MENFTFTDAVQLENVVNDSFSTATLAPDEPNDTEHAVAFCGFMIPFFIVGVVGHVVVVLSVFYHEELHRPLNVIIVNLSISQFFMLSVTVFGDVIVMLTKRTYTGAIDRREVLCFFTLLCSTSTSVFYGLLAANRVLSTIFEALYARLIPWKLVWTLVISGWALSLLASCFPWMTTAVDYAWDSYFILGFPWFHALSPNSPSLHWLLMCAYFFIPAGSIVACYVAIYMFTTRTQRLSGLPVNSPRAVNLRDRARVVLMLLTVSAIYLVCFYASFIYFSAETIHSRSGSYVFLFLVFVPNSWNPIIYGVIHPEFRAAYFRVGVLILRRTHCRAPYGPDKRRVFPAAVSMDFIGPPSVIFHSAKNSVSFQNNLQGHFNGLQQDSQFVTVKLPTSTRNLQVKIVEADAGPHTKGHE